MAVRKLPSTWVSTQAYSVDDVVQHNGVRFVCVTAVSANSEGNDDPVDNSSWDFDGILRITDYYSLQYAIEFEMNTDDNVVNNSIPVYVQNVERMLSKVLRSPAQRVSRKFTCDSDGKFAIPNDLLEIIHLKVDSDNTGNTLEARGSVSIQKVDRTSYEELAQNYEGSGYYLVDGLFDFPVYYTDDTYIWIAPIYDNGTEFEMTYYQQVPELGSTVGLVNNDYEAVNSNDETLAQWVANGNAAADFVQAEEMVTKNLWTATTPHLLKAGALSEAYSYLNDTNRMQAVNAQYKELLEATIIEFRKFDAGGSTSLQQRSAYSY